MFSHTGAHCQKFSDPNAASVALQTQLNERKYLISWVKLQPIPIKLKAFWNLLWFTSIQMIQTRSTPLWTHRTLFWQLSRGRNLHDSGMSRRHDSLSKTILQRISDLERKLERKLEGGRHHGPHRKC